MNNNDEGFQIPEDWSVDPGFAESGKKYSKTSSRKT